MIGDERREHVPLMMELTKVTDCMYNHASLIHCVNLYGDGGNIKLDLYDGIDSSGKHVLSLGTKNYETRSVEFPKPVVFYRGIYAVLSSAFGVLTVAFEPYDI